MTKLYLLYGYIALLIIRPFEIWAFLGNLHLERGYTLLLLLFVLANRSTAALPRNRVNLACGLLITSVLAATIFSIDIGRSLIPAQGFIENFIFYLVLLCLVRDTESLHKVIAFFILVMFVYMGKSAWEYYVHGRLTYRMGIARMGGIDIAYGDPNYFGATILYSLPFCLHLYHLAKSYRQRIFYCAYFLLSVLCIVMSGSRSSMATGLLFLGLFWLTSKRKFSSALFVGALLTFVWFQMGDPLQARFISIIIPEAAGSAAQASASGRMQGFLHGFRLLSEYPIFGVGPGNFMQTWSLGIQPHNLPGQIAGELGLFGLVAFVFFLYSLFMTNRRIARFARMQLKQETTSSPSLRPYEILHSLSISIMMILILMLFKGAGDHNLYRYTWIWLAGFTAVSSNIMNNFLSLHRPHPNGSIDLNKRGRQRTTTKPGGTIKR